MLYNQIPLSSLTKILQNDIITISIYFEVSLLKKIFALLGAFMLTTTVYAEKLIVTYDNTNTLYAVSRYAEEKDASSNTTRREIY